MRNTHADDAAVLGQSELNLVSPIENKESAVQKKPPDWSTISASDREAPAFVLDMFDVARFWSRVEVRKQEQCWPWRWGSDEEGYGEYRYVRDLRESAHRVAYRLVYGPIAAGAVIRHACDNPLCCNWAHLIAGTHADNVQDRVDRDRSARGEENGRAKLTAEQVAHVRDSHMGSQALANLYEVDLTTIKAIRRYKTWKHLP